MNTKFICNLLLIALFTVVSCDNKNDDYDPITLSYVDDALDFDNEVRRISVYLFNESLPMRINGGDGNYSVVNNNEDIIDFELDNKVLIVNSILSGSGSITIKDNSGNSYTLNINVYNSQNQLYTFAEVKSDNISAERKAELEEKIISDAPKGIWDLGNSYLQDGKTYKAKRYLTYKKDSEYLEYNCTVQGERSQETAFIFRTQIVKWFVMKSDTEEFVLFLCQPFYLDNGALVVGYNSVSDVTHRYVSDYPEITHAYEIQAGHPLRYP